MPQTKGDILQTIKQNIKDKSARLTNFIEGTFDRIFTEAFVI